MTLNNFMHPRNIYRKPPNFKELALKYPEFRPHAKPDLNGKVVVDFKDQNALRVLLKILMKKDFGLDIEMPTEKLVPTLPLRLNYILWVEDLLGAANLSNPIGIDIGVGASCIYPLLAAKKNWKMLGTESDPNSYNCAVKNVEINNLQSLISVSLVKEDTILIGAIDSNVDYTFCMCNPPFYSSIEESKGKSRSPDTRTPPRNAPTGTFSEIITKGGETAFVGRIIADSKKLQNKIKIYTTMIGIKSNLKPLVNILKSNSVASLTQTTFCQGRTTRWGLAWTYDSTIRFPERPIPKKIKEKPLQQEFYPPFTEKSVEKDICALLDKLEIEYTEIKKNNSVRVFELRAYKNTWSNQRRKRRAEKMKQNDTDANNIDKGMEMPVDQPTITSQESLLQSEFDKNCRKRKLENVIALIDEIGAESGSSIEPKFEASNGNYCESNLVHKNYEVVLEAESENFKKLKLDTGEKFSDLFNAASCLEYSHSDLLLKCTLGIRNLKTKILVDLLYIDGSGGKEAMNQILLFIKNHMKQNIFEVL